MVATMTLISAYKSWVSTEQRCLQGDQPQDERGQSNLPNKWSAPIGLPFSRAISAPEAKYVQIARRRSRSARLRSAQDA